MVITIITISFNAEKTIEETINSVLSQKDVNIEYIVVDGASFDNTLNILAKYENDISIIISEPDKGLYDAMNKGLSLASGDIIGFLNADDIYIDDTILMSVVNCFDQGNAEIVYGDLYYSDGTLSNVQRYWKTGKITTNWLRLGRIPPHPSFFVKKPLVEKLGGFKIELDISADYEFMLRYLTYPNVIINYLNKVLVNMREGGISNNRIKNRLKGNSNILKAWRVNKLPSPSFFFMPCSMIEKLCQIIRAWSISK